MGLLRWGEPLDGGEKRRIPNRRLVLRFWRREDGGGDGLPELWRDCPFFQSVGQFPSWPGTYKGLVRPKALRKAGDLCSRQWEERLAGRALWRQCLWERGDLSLGLGGAARLPAAVALPMGNGRPPNRGHQGRNRQHPALNGRGKADREGRRSPAAVEVGSAFAQSRGTPLYRWVASVAVGDRPLGERLSTRWKGATSAPAVAGKSPSIFWPVGWGKGSALSSLLTWGTENTG